MWDLRDDSTEAPQELPGAEVDQEPGQLDGRVFFQDREPDSALLRLMMAAKEETGFAALREQIKARPKRKFYGIYPAPMGETCRECGGENLGTQVENDVRWYKCEDCGAFYSKLIPGKEY
jgi:hypothetical protein